LYDALIHLVPQTQAAQEQRDYQLLVEGLNQIAPTVSNFFDGSESVLVMDTDPKIRRNRLNLLSLLRNHARVLADFGAIVKANFNFIMPNANVIGLGKSGVAAARLLKHSGWQVKLGDRHTSATLRQQQMQLEREELQLIWVIP
jgi:hypothetical protein